MTKNEFLSQLREKLSGISEEDREKTIEYYSEMIDDRIEDGMTEEEAVAALGDIEDIVNAVLSDISIFKLVKEKVKPKRRLKPWEIVLIIVGSPLWGSLLIAAAAVFISLYAVLWALVATLYAVSAATLVSSVACFASFGAYISSEPAVAFLMLGIAFIAFGVSIFLSFLSNLSAKSSALLGKKIFLGVKKSLSKKEVQ